MKKLDTTQGTDPTGQQPFTAPMNKFIQDAYTEAIDSIARNKGYNQTNLYVLYGCVNSTPGGTTYTISAGAVYYAGEIYLVPAVTLTVTTGVPVGKLSTTYPSSTIYEDNTSHYDMGDRKIAISEGTSGTGITGNSNSDFSNWINEQWNSVGGTGQPAFQNSWNNYSSGTHAVARFRKEGANTVVLSGLVSGGATGTVVFTLPVGFRPTKIMIFPLGGDSTSGYVLVDANGTVSITYTAGSFWSIEGIRIPID